MNSSTFLAHTGAFGKAAKAAIDKQLANRSPYQRRAFKLRRDVDPCKHCGSPRNGDCFNRACSDFVGHA